MALQTSKFQFVKPELTDSPPDITVTNSNWDLVDILLEIQNVVYMNSSMNDDFAISIRGIEDMNSLFGIIVKFSTAIANNGACTLNVNSLGAFPMLKWGTVSLTSRDVLENAIVEVAWNGANFQLLNPTGDVRSDGTINLSKLTVGDRLAGSIEGTKSSSQGSLNTASGDFSSARGYSSIAKGNMSIADGYFATALAMGSRATGGGTISADGSYFRIISYDNTLKTITLELPYVGYPITIATLNIGDELIIANEISPQLFTTITAVNDNVITVDTTRELVDLMWAIYQDTNGSSLGGDASGTMTVAMNDSHAEGIMTIATEMGAHAEGQFTEALGFSSHTEGVNTRALGEGSHAEGDSTIAQGDHQHVSGIFNAPNADDLVQVGNGTSEENRRNAFALDKWGTGTFNGNVIAGDGSNLQALNAQMNGPEYTADLSQNKAIYSVGTASDGTNLTSSIIEGQIMPAVKGNTIRNGVKNGNFYLGGSYWTVASGTFSASNNIATLTGNGTLDYVRLLSDGNTHAYINAHKYYVGFTFKAKSSLCISVMARIADEAVGNVLTATVLSSPVINTLYKLSNIFTTTASGTGRTRLIVDSVYANAANSNGSATEISNVVMVDLTQLYGAGNEPTVAQFEALLNGYVDNLSGIANLTMKSVGKNICGVLETGNYNNETGLPVVNSLYARTRDYIPIKSGVSYRISGEISTDVRLFYYNSSKIFISTEVITFSTTQVFTVPATARYVKFHTLLTKLTNGILSKVQIEEGSTATSYEEYEESTMEVPTLYKLPNGVYDEILDDGTHVKRIGEKTLVALDITAIDTTSYTNLDIVHFVALSDAISQSAANNSNSFLTTFSRPITVITGIDNISNLWTHGYGTAFMVTKEIVMYVPKGSFTSLAVAQSALAGTKVIYELATPVTTLNAVTPLTVHPKGTISLDSSIIPETIISYPIDIAGVIKNLNQAVTALSEGANVIDSLVSSDRRKALSAYQGKLLNDLLGIKEGTWTPTVTAGGTNILANITYVKYRVINKRFFATLEFTVQANSITAPVVISGIPFILAHIGAEGSWFNMTDYKTNPGGAVMTYPAYSLYLCGTTGALISSKQMFVSIDAELA